mmetsp:Transcript_18331/g.27228  ORF Transcript_18331/g.27228 Transcript_18331/m.27228 type:complete len:998 (-) Transcript_18331:677-3670(-)
MKWFPQLLTIICAFQHNNRSNAFTSTTTTTPHINIPRASFLNAGATTARYATSNQKQDTTSTAILSVGKLVGRGSYGTVHICNINDNDTPNNERQRRVIGKRAWNQEDLIRMSKSKNAKTKNGNKSDEGESLVVNKNIDEKFFAEKAKRCKKYLDVERHCLDKLLVLRDSFSDYGADGSNPWQLPELVGSFMDSESNEWAAFSFISNGDDSIDADSSSSSSPKAAMSLSDAISLQKWGSDVDVGQKTHRLSVVQRALGLEEDNDDDGFGKTLDHILQSLLRVVSCVHKGNVVHRDIKPDNLLLDPTSKSLILIDFGSAADLDPSSITFSSSILASLGIGAGGRVGLEIDVVAVSPIYAAPEVFIKLEKSPKTFDVFSSAMVFTQLLFSLFDQRTDAAFRQQLEEADYNLDAWLARELSAKLRPTGIDEAVSYLGERPGLYTLLKDMLRRDPNRRPSSLQALDVVNDILTKRANGVVVANDEEDGSFFASVLEASEFCEVDYVDAGAVDKIQYELTSSSLSSEDDVAQKVVMSAPRPLNFVASFERASSLGLMLAEADADVEEDYGDDADKLAAWNTAIAGAVLGEVFVKDVVEGGQADEMGIFEVGDRLTGVGDLAIGTEGFGHVVDMLGKQPERSKTVSLHFMRKSVATTITPTAATSATSSSRTSSVIDQGAWSISGRRKTQEDAFVLHEFRPPQNDAYHLLLAGVFDGHGGDAASATLSKFLPDRFANSLFSDDRETQDFSGQHLANSIEEAWESICDSYRSGCDGDGESCAADYDAIEGIIKAGTGSKDLVAGTTASAAILRYDDANEVTILNCGDSRTILVGKPRASNEASSKKLFGRRKPSLVHFCTRDHSPKDEIEGSRLQAGREAGLDYSLPQCSMSRWWLSIGDYQYAVARSLEGGFATSKGIVSEPDVTTISLNEMSAEREFPSLVIASDGLFEVLDNEQVAQIVLKLRMNGENASDVAKALCTEALRKGSSDNVSAVVVLLDDKQL